MLAVEDAILEEMMLEDIAAEVATESGCVSKLTAAELEAEGCWPWYEEIFGREFVEALAPHHRQAIEWHWNARTSLIAHLVIQFLAYFSIWARGNMKTTVARRIIICDACLSTTAGTGGYALIVGGTKKKVRGSAVSIETLLHSPKIKQYYPALAEVKKNERGASKGWTADYINTRANYVFHFIGLDEGVAGANFDDIRPTLIVPDDIDDREDSPVISEARFQTFTRAVLPTRQANTLVFFAQNLISRFSCMYRIWKQQARVLTNRFATEPIKAVNGLVTETRTVNGIVKDVVVSGVPTWHGWDLKRVQEEIDTYGLPAFNRECQHEVEQSREGLALQNWDDAVHVISRSQFAAVYGTRTKPQRWYGFGYNDFARTKTKFHANVVGFITVAGQNSPNAGSVFLFDPLSFPANTAPEDVARAVLTAISPTVIVHGQARTWDKLIESAVRKTNLEQFISDTSELIKQRRAMIARILPPVVSSVLRAQNYRTFRGSHEQGKTGALGVYSEVFGIPFMPMNPGGDGGLDTLNLYQKVDYGAEHPFKPGERGRSNYYVVTEDDLTQTPVVINGVEVYPPKPYNDALSPDELHGEDLLRYQFKNWRHRDPQLTVAGEVENGLLKLNDDHGNGHMMLFCDGLITQSRMTADERFEIEHPEASIEAIEQADGQAAREQIIATRDILVRQKRAKHREGCGPLSTMPRVPQRPKIPGR